MASETKQVDLKDRTPQEYELVAALAVNALCEIGNYSDADDLHDEAEEEYGVSDGEAIEMAYDNVLFTARSAVSRIIDQLAKPAPSPAPQSGEGQT